MRAALAALALIAAPAAAQQVAYPPLDTSVQKTALYLNDVVLAQSALLSLQPTGVQSFTVATNCQVGDRLFMTPGGVVPAGYMLGDIYCASAGTATAKLFTPALGIGVSYSITVRVTAFR